MIINLLPRRLDAALTVVRAGDMLTINGEAFDFSALPAGAMIVIDGVLHVTLFLPHGWPTSQSVAYPLPLIDPPDGVLALPSDPLDPAEEETAHVDA